MADKLSSPIVLRAASLTLTGSLAVVVGTVSTDNANATSGAVSLGAISGIVLRASYARNGSSTTGRPRFRVDISIDPPSTAPAAVSNWQPLYLLDGSSFSSGVIEMYPEVQSLNPTASGTSVFGTHTIDVSVAHWIRVSVYDVDGSNPGTITGLSLGGFL